MFLFRNGVITMNINETNGELPFGEQPPIDVNEYLKSIEETTIISIEENVRNYLKSKKEHNTLSETQQFNGWGKPQGVTPVRAYSFEDILSKVQSNPNEPFSLSDVWINTAQIYIITKFNRIPSVSAAIQSLNFAGGLNWEALDTPHYYIAFINNEIVLVSTIGGHRGTMGVLTNGFGSELPSRVTYVGSLDINVVHERCALIHHIDCNKRANQNANDRMSSGVEAKDPKFIRYMEDLLRCKLYIDSNQMKQDKITDYRQISSWMNFVNTLKVCGFEHTYWASEHLRKNTEQGEKIISQAIETVARTRYHFNNEIKKVKPEGDVFAEFIEWYFNECCEDQHELRTDGDVVKNCLKLVDKFNKWSKKRYARRYNAILDQAKVDAFGDGVTVS